MVVARVSKWQFKKNLNIYLEGNQVPVVHTFQEIIQTSSALHMYRFCLYVSDMLSEAQPS